MNLLHGSSAFPVSSRPGSLTGYTSMAVFLLGAMALVVPAGYDVGAAMLVLGSALLLFRWPGRALGREEWALVGVLLAYAAVGAAEVWWDGQALSALVEPGRFLLAVPVLILLRSHPPRSVSLWGGVAAGGIASGVLAGWQTLIAGAPRAEGAMDSIQFGDLSLLLGSFCLAGLGWAVMQLRARTWLALLLLGAGMGLLGSLLSGTRGGWVSLPFMLGVLYWGYATHLSRRALIGLAALIVTGAVAVYAIPQLGVQERVQRTFNSAADFVRERDITNSVGGRFEMWRTAMILISDKPLLGWGQNGYAQARDRLIAEGEIHPSLERFGHVHNEVLDAWLKRGLPGLAALAALYLVPLRLFARRLRSPDLQLRAFAIAGVLLPVAYMSFGLTQALFTYASGVTMYAFWLVVLWAGMRRRERAS